MTDPLCGHRETDQIGRQEKRRADDAIPGGHPERLHGNPVVAVDRHDVAPLLNGSGLALVGGFVDRAKGGLLLIAREEHRSPSIGGRLPTLQHRAARKWRAAALRWLSAVI